MLFSFRRSHGCRILELEYIASGDSSDGSLLCSEVADLTVTQSTGSLADTLFIAGDGNFLGAKNSGSG